MCWERYIRGGIFGEVYSAFESWQVPRHSNLYVKLPTSAMHLHENCVCFLPTLPALPALPALPVSISCYSGRIVIEQSTL